MKVSARTLWQFGRPHTLIGTAISVGVLYALAAGEYLLLPENIALGSLALASSLFCNYFITGWNQIIDLPLDRVNKPNLPLPAGRLTVERAQVLVISTLLLSWILALMVSWRLLGWIALISALGMAYSWKKIYLKRGHATAAMAIVLVRGLMVNLGCYHALLLALPQSEGTILTPVPLAVFFTFFSLGIAWYKDIPDMEGDKTFGIGTLAVRYGRKQAWIAATTVVILGFSAMLVLPWPAENPWLFRVTQGLLLIMFLVLVTNTNYLSKASMSRFYKLFWVLFFLEYLLFPFIL